MNVRSWKVYASLGSLAIAGYFVLPLHRLPLNVTYDAIGLSSAVAIVVGTLRRRPRAFGAWLLFALAQGLFVAGDTYLTVVEAVWHTEPFPSAADALYIAGYPTFAVGLLLLIRARTPGRDWAALIDAAIVTTGVAAVAWVFVMEPYTRDTTLPLLSKLVSISNPIGSLLLLAVASRLLLGTRARTPVFYAITARALAAARRRCRVCGAVVGRHLCRR